MSIALILWGFWGFSLSVMGVVEQSLEQALIPREFLARVMTVMSSAAMALMPVGSLVGGYLANRLGPGLLYVLIGCALIAIALVMVFNTAIRTATVGDAQG